MSWLPAAGAGANDFERTFGLRPNLYAAWRDFASLFWERRIVPPALLELVRLRIAQMHGMNPRTLRRMTEARDAGFDEARVALLDHWWKTERFDGTERACLHFAEQFVLDPRQLSDEDAARVRESLGDAGLVGFVEALALFDGFTRFQLVLGIAPEVAA